MVHKSDKNILQCKICKRPYDNAKAKDFAVVDGTIACLKHPGVKQWLEDAKKITVEFIQKRAESEAKLKEFQNEPSSVDASK